MSALTIRPATKLLLVGAIIALSAACAAPQLSNDPARMIAYGGLRQPGFPDSLHAGLCTGPITGGQSTNQLGGMDIDNSTFHQALDANLRVHGLLATTGCRYRVSANLLGLSQPTAGRDLKVTSHVNYRVGADGHQPFLLETVSAPFTVTSYHSFNNRLQHANEGSIRASMAIFLLHLRNSQPTP